MEGIFGRRRLLGPRAGPKTCQVHSLIVQKASPLHFPFLILLVTEPPRDMSTNVSTISTVSSLSSDIPPSGCTSPSSAQSNAGWGSQDILNVLTPSADHLERSTTSAVKPSPILSVDIPIYAHCLCEGTLGEPERDTLHSLLYIFPPYPLNS